MKDYVKLKLVQKIDGVKHENIVKRSGFELTVDKWGDMLEELTRAVLNDEAVKEIFRR